MALSLSFWMTTSTGRTPYWLGSSLPKASFTFSMSDVGIGTDGNLCVALVAGVTGGGRGLEGRLLVGGKGRGYTQEKSQMFENKRHLFSLPSPSGVCAARPLIVFRCFAASRNRHTGKAYRSGSDFFPALLDRLVRARSGCMQFRWAKCWRAWNSRAGCDAPSRNRGFSSPPPRWRGARRRSRNWRESRTACLLCAGGLRFRGAARVARVEAVAGGGGGDRDLAEPVSRGAAHRARAWRS